MSYVGEQKHTLHVIIRNLQVQKLTASLKTRLTQQIKLFWKKSQVYEQIYEKTRAQNSCYFSSFQFRQNLV